MKSILTKTTLIVLALSVAACSATPVRRSMKETWNDSLTASKIRYKLMRDSGVSKTRTHVEVFRGQVTLTGRAMTDAEKARAETLAKSAKRVTGVENYVHVVGGSDTAVAKAPVTGVPIVAVSPKAGTAPASAIKEKTLVADKAKATPTADDIPAELPTIRESTGKPAAAPAPAAPVTASRKAVTPKVAASAAKNNKLAKGKPSKSEAPLATVRKSPDRSLGQTSAPVTAAKSAAPVITAPPMARGLTPDLSVRQVPATKVVGQSKTGLPWDGEVYEDDATRVSSPAKAAATPKAATATRTPAPAPAAPTSAPAVSPAPATGDDLAKEAAQELEKLRLKK